MIPQSLSRAARCTAVAVALAALIPASSLTTGCFVDRRQVADTHRTEAFDLFTQGQELERRGDLTRAIDYYARAAELSPRPAFYSRAGSVHAKLGQHTQAVHFFDLALALNPDLDSARAERDLSLIALSVEEETLPPGTPRLEVADVLTDPTTKEPTPQATPPTAPNGPIIAVAPEEPTESPAVEIPSTPDPGPAWETPVSPEPVLPTPPALPTAPAEPAAAPATSLTFQIPAEEDAIAINPGDLPPRRVRAAGEGLDRERIRSALFSHVANADPQDLAAEREAARAASEAQRWDEATRRWERIAGQNPADLDARLRLADSLQRSGRSVRAWDVYAEAARMEPANSTVHREWGNSLVRAGELDKAAARYAEVLRLAPDLAEVRNNLAAIDIERGRAPQAVRDLESLVAQRPDFAPAWLNLAIAVERANGERARQVAALETYLRLDGTRDAEVERWLVELRSSR